MCYVSAITQIMKSVNRTMIYLAFQLKPNTFMNLSYIVQIVPALSLPMNLYFNI